MSLENQSLKIHEQSKGKVEIGLKVKLNNHDDLSLIYTPGVSAVCRKISEDKKSVRKYTIKSNSVAVITDGSAVLGLGNIGCEAALPVMEGKCALFKKFAGVDAFPLCIESDNVDEFVNVVKRITTVFGGINLEDISAPNCFEIEKRLINELDIPVFHDDQHGTAIVALSALINALKVVGKQMGNIKIVISGAGAAGSAISKLLIDYGAMNILVCDRRGIICRDREYIKENDSKRNLAEITNPKQISGDLRSAVKEADVFLGVSAPNVLTGQMVASMNSDAIVFALANPIPEIMPEVAFKAGARIVGTGRSDLPNQINNVLAFPGIFRGILDSNKTRITNSMKIRAAEAIARLVESPIENAIIPDVFDERVVPAVATAIMTDI